MQFLLLWSGEISGANKARIDGVKSKGITGYYMDGEVYVPDSVQTLAAMPKRHHAAFKRSVVFNGLPQLWDDATDNCAPLTMRLYYARPRKIMAVYYFQPLTKEDN
jgi:hypothetical protein